LINKLEKDDIISIVWEKDKLYYKVREIKIVDDEDLSILKDSNTPILTLFSCEPIYSQDKRIVVISDLIIE